MFVLVWSDNEILASDNTVRTFATHDDAWAAMVEEFVESLRREGNEPVLPTDGGDVFDLDCKGLFLGYMSDNEAFTEHCEEKWVIFEVPDSPTPKRNPNIAETVAYECKGDPTFRSREVLLHQATVRWNSGKSFECHAPERVELRIGGTSYEYKAI